MRDHEHGKLHRQSKLIKGVFKSYRTYALLLAILLGFVDILIISGLRPTDHIGELVLPMRMAVLLTIGTIVLTVGTVASFLSALRDRMTQVGGQHEQQRIRAEETDISNARSRAA